MSAASPSPADPPVAAHGNEDQAQYWTERADAWQEVQRAFESVIADLGELAVQKLAAAPGMHLLDVGCGTGATTLALARKVAPDGRVVGADISSPLLATARRDAEQAGLPVEFVHADAQVHDFGEGVFDGIFSRFGVMFFADPVAAFTNLRRALKPGGRLSFVAWQSVFSNDWALVPAAAAVSVLGVMPAVPEPGQPGPFSLSDPALVNDVLGKAGFGDIDVVEHNDEAVIDQGRIVGMAGTAPRLGAVEEMLADADDATVGAVILAIENALRERVVDGAVRMARGVLLVSATA